MGNRIAFFDVARALCILWIVCVWHINAYLDVSFKFFLNNTIEKETFSYVTDGVLALFTFISGFFISQKIIQSRKDVAYFYRKRLLRFLVPLFLSCLILACGGFITYTHIFTICLGLSQFLPYHYPDTLWYFSMIIFFYLITPLMLWIKGENLYMCSLFCVFVLVFLLVGSHFFSFDKRLAVNFVFYAIPFLIKPSSIITLLKSKWSYLVIPVCAYIVIIQKPSCFCCQIINNVSACFVILSISNIFSYSAILRKCFGYIAYASMFMYLFHREVYITLRKIIGDFNYIEAYAICLIILVLSYYGQKFYDQFVVKKI